MNREEKPKTEKLFRVVLDTNVYYSAFYTQENALSPLLAFGIRKTGYCIVSSPYILHELHTILTEKLLWEENQSLAVIRKIAEASVMVNPNSPELVIAYDPDDNHILACALEGKADLIVTGDRDLLRLKDYQGIPIVRPIDFLRTLGSSD